MHNRAPARTSTCWAIGSASGACRRVDNLPVLDEDEDGAPADSFAVWSVSPRCRGSTWRPRTPGPHDCARTDTVATAKLGAREQLTPIPPPVTRHLHDSVPPTLVKVSRRTCAMF